MHLALRKLLYSSIVVLLDTLSMLRLSLNANEPREEM